MTTQLRFDGKVAIVTGAGGGLGRQYALDLARRGAKVVVNDLGGSARGDGANSAAADKVVSEIRSFGGEAVPNYDSVTDGAKIVQTAISAYGRIDILVNNAGILRDVSFAKSTDQDWKLLQNVHLDGAFQVTRAAWPYMRQQNYGRIIVVSSAAGLYGNFGQTAYSAVKMGLVGFANTLAIEGAKQNILTNVIAPIAGSRMTETVLPPELVAALKPEYVSPLVQYLAHDSNKQNGAIFEVGAGWVSRVRWERTKGVSFPLQKFSVDDIAREINKINDFKDANHPTSNADIFPLIMANIDRARDEAYKAEASAPAATAAPAKTGKLNPNVDLKRALAHPMPTLPHTYTERDVMLYALGIGAAADQLDQSELKFVYEGHADFQAFPTFGVVIPSATLGHLASIQGLTFNPMMQVHGEQFMELRKPLPTSGTLTSHPRIVNLYDKGSGALLVLEVSSKDASGEEVIFNQFSLFIRGLGGFGGEKGPATISYDPPKDTAPEVVHREKTLANQAILYRLSGDMNPLHIDVELAKTGNFPKPILHGLCSFGYASRAVVKHFANNDGRRFKSVRARFASPVFPGETLVTEMWRAPNNPNRILFRARVAERGVVVINGAYIDLHPETAATAAPVAKPAAAASAPAPAAAPAGTFLAEGVFAQLSKQASPELVAKIKAVFRFDIENATGVKRSWLLDLKNGSGSIRDASDADKADCTIVIKDKDFVALMAGKLNAQSAFMKGQLKIRGNLMLAQKLQLLQPKKSKL